MFIQSFCEAVLSDSNKSKALQLIAFYQHIWDTVGDDGFIEGIIPGLRRALRRNQTLLPLLVALMKEETKYSKSKLAHIILEEVLGEQFLLNDELLEAMNPVLEKLGA